MIRYFSASAIVPNLRYPFLCLLFLKNLTFVCVLDILMFFLTIYSTCGRLRGLVALAHKGSLLIARRNLYLIPVELDAAILFFCS